MKYWSYNEPLWHGDEIIGNAVMTLSEEEIIKEYYPYWEAEMIKKWGEERFRKEWCKRDCIDCWVVVNWAWEVTEKTHEPN